MKHTRFFLVLSLFICLLAIQSSFPGQITAQKNVLLRFHSFPLNPGEKVIGAQVTVSNGHIMHTMMPRGWEKKYERGTDGKHKVHCFSTHSSHGIAASGRMPVLSIAPINGKTLSVEASVEIESGDGKSYTRQMLDSELSLQ